MTTGWRRRWPPVTDPVRKRPSTSVVGGRSRPARARLGRISDRTLPEKSLAQATTPSEAVERTGTALRNALPDDEFRYTDTNRHLLARLVAQASGETFNGYLEAPA